VSMCGAAHGDAESVRGRRPRPPVMDHSWIYSYSMILEGPLDLFVFNDLIAGNIPSNINLNLIYIFILLYNLNKN
jgi:hypothetical protein